MNIIITDSALCIIGGLLVIAFLPHIYLFLIFAIMGLVEFIEYVRNIAIKYIYPLALMALLYLTILYIFHLDLTCLLDQSV